MLSSYDMACLSRLEDRWLDPDYNTIPEDEEDDEYWDYADRRTEEKWIERILQTGSTV